DLAVASRAVRGSLVPEPPAEGTPVARQPPSAVDAEPALRQDPEERVLVHPVRDGGHERTQPSEELRGSEQPLAPPDALRRATRHRGISRGKSAPQRCGGV